MLQYFVTGSNEGTLSLWDIGRKKPIFSVRRAHNDDDDDEEESSDDEGESGSDSGDDSESDSEMQVAAGPPAAGATEAQQQNKEAAAAAAAAARWPSNAPSDSTSPNWIASVAAIRNGDVYVLCLLLWQFTLVACLWCSHPNSLTQMRPQCCVPFLLSLTLLCVSLLLVFLHLDSGVGGPWRFVTKVWLLVPVTGL